MSSSAVFYHAGCPICVDAEKKFVSAIDKTKYNIEVVHLGQNKNRIAEAETKGVKSVPAMVMDGNVYHINFGAGISDLKK